MQWQLHQDGSFDLTGGPVTLRGCYPALDGVAARALRVTVTPDAAGGLIRYALTAGELALVLSVTSIFP